MRTRGNAPLLGREEDDVQRKGLRTSAFRAAVKAKLQRGQWRSAGMVLVGLSVVLYVMHACASAISLQAENENLRDARGAQVTLSPIEGGTPLRASVDISEHDTQHIHPVRQEDAVSVKSDSTPVKSRDISTHRNQNSDVDAQSQQSSPTKESVSAIDAAASVNAGSATVQNDGDDSTAADTTSPEFIDIEDSDSLQRVAQERYFRAAQSSTGRVAKCDVPCIIKGGGPLVGTFSVYDERNVRTTFMSTMEGPKHYPRSRDKGTHDGLSTTSYLSDIPMPYYSEAEYDIKTTPVNFTEVIPGISFAARNCRSLNNREGLVRTLQKYIQVDSVSSCLNNAPWPADIKRSDKSGMMRKYLFHLSAENENSDDYITEKVWGALSSGSLPVYLGAPNVNLYVPEHSVVSAADFASFEELGEHLLYLTKNRTAYMEYHAWRFKPFSERFERTFAFTRTHSECRRCRWAYARRMNLGWDHCRQEIIWRQGAPFESPRRCFE